MKETLQSVSSSIIQNMNPDYYAWANNLNEYALKKEKMAVEKNYNTHKSSNESVKSNQTNGSNEQSTA